jgi:SNF2 family DNA or RNA helicase
MNEKFNIIKEHFIKVYTKEIECEIPIEKIYIHNVDTVTHYIYNIDDIIEPPINNNFVFKHRFTSLPIKKTIYIDKHFRFSKWNCDCIMYPFSKESEHLITNFENYNGHYDTYIHFFTNEQGSNMYFLKANIIVLFEICEGKTTLCYYISKKMYEAGIMNRKVNNKTSYLMDLLESDAIEKRNKKAEEALMIILNEPSKNKVYDINISIPELKDSIQLYNYQKADIKWMTGIKDAIDRNENVLSLNYIDYHKVILQDIYSNEPKEYILFEGKLVNATIENKTMNINYIGGNIISEIGTGKTLITLGYLSKNFTNKYDRFISFENTLCNYFYKRGKNKGKSCEKKKIDELYCKEHSKTIFIDKRKTILNKIEIDKSFSLRDQIIEIGEHWNKKKLFKSNASLILCPNQLCDQWVREYYEKFKQSEVSKRILLIVTYDQYRNITFGELLFADIIIVSYDFLKNTNYLKRGNISRWSSRQNITEVLDDIDNELNVELNEKLSEDGENELPLDLSVTRILDKFNVKLNILDNFYYQNIIFDEFHEIKDGVFNDTLKLFNSKYRWNITATPFANGLNSFVNSIRNITNKNFDYIDDKIDVNIINSFSKLYRRNTKESIKEEYTQTEITDTLKLLKFTEQERRIYDAHSLNKSNSTKDFLIKLCCDTSIDIETKNLVKNCKTLDEIEAVILNHNKKKLQGLKKIIDEYTNKITKLEEQVNIGFVPVIGFNFENTIILTMEDLRTTLGNVRRTLTINKKEYNEINRTYTFLKNAVENIKTSETCPICLDDECTDVAITKCGHKFCKDCIHEYVEEMGKRGDTKCPKCNIPIKIDEIYLLKETKELELKASVETNNELSSVISRVKSTKIGNIIYFIKNCLKETDKCIIFSQWDTLLTKVGKLLKAENIPPLFCSGTIYQRKRSIKAFQEDPKSRIICLSSENCASGINLTAANKIIFIEPVYGNKQRRIDIENQAIGRSSRLGQKRPIEVIRFIIKDTIEQDIYNDNEKELNYNIIDTEPLELNGNILEI